MGTAELLPVPKSSASPYFQPYPAASEMAALDFPCGWAWGLQCTNKEWEGERTSA